MTTGWWKSATSSCCTTSRTVCPWRIRLMKVQLAKQSTLSNAKILSLDELGKKLRQLREDGKRIVMCHGTFDLMHTGHIRHLQRAKREGDILLVTVTGDAYVKKGPGRPVFGEDLRAETLAALACVD